MEILWRSNLELAAYHAAWCVARWPYDDLKVPADFYPAADALIAATDEFSTSRSSFWDCLFQLAPDCSAPGELVQRILRLLTGEDDVDSKVNACLQQALEHVQATFKSVYPNFESELRLRMTPIREHWEAYGPGLLRSMHKLAMVHVEAQQCEVFAVLPHCGGVGYPHYGNTRLRLEIMLTNRHPRIPETLHLAWLIALTHHEAMLHSQENRSDRERWIAQLGWIPVTFAAAEDLEVSELQVGLISQAIELWWIDHKNSSDRLAEHLCEWWHSAAPRSVGWDERLKELDHRLRDIADDW